MANPACAYTREISIRKGCGWCKEAYGDYLSGLEHTLIKGKSLSVEPDIQSVRAILINWGQPSRAGVLIIHQTKTTGAHP